MRFVEEKVQCGYVHVALKKCLVQKTRMLGRPVTVLVNVYSLNVFVSSQLLKTNVQAITYHSAATVY